jgi:hypothetical protein
MDGGHVEVQKTDKFAAERFTVQRMGPARAGSIGKRSRQVVGNWRNCKIIHSLY